jgi:hypothetical protein
MSSLAALQDRPLFLFKILPTQALFRAETWMDLDCADQVENHLIIPWAEYG